MADERVAVTLGVDTHRDVHVGVVVDEMGRVLGDVAAPAEVEGYEQLVEFASSHGEVAAVGVEGTGAYGAGLARYLRDQGIRVVEVDRPNRQLRRRRGKSDTTDAEAAARAVWSGQAQVTPKSQNGIVESIRVLRIARSSALKARTQVANQIKDLVVTAPEELRRHLGGLTTTQRVEACAQFDPEPGSDPLAATKRALRHLARRYQTLTAELDELNADLDPLTRQAAPRLLAQPGVGPESAGKLLIAAGDNPDRLHSEAALAALCGVSPIEASSGKTTRHRLNRGGNRDANNALWTIARNRMRHHPETISYYQRRTQEGKTKDEITRCIKRALARRLYPLLLADLTATQQPDLT